MLIGKSIKNSVGRMPGAVFLFRGERGIRTPDTVTRTSV